MLQLVARLISLLRARNVASRLWLTGPYVASNAPSDCKHPSIWRKSSCPFGCHQINWRFPWFGGIGGSHGQ